MHSIARDFMAMDVPEALIEELLSKLLPDRWLYTHAQRIGEWASAIALDLGLDHRLDVIAHVAMLAQVPPKGLYGYPRLRPYRPVLRAVWRLRDGVEPEEHARVAHIVLVASQFEDLVRPRDARLSLSPMHALDALHARGLGEEESVLVLRRIMLETPAAFRYARPGAARIADER